MTAAAPPDVTITSAAPDDRLDVMRVLDGAMLETDHDALAARIDAGRVLVARAARSGDRSPVVAGVLVWTRPDAATAHLDAVAVRQSRRGRGVGSALVERASTQAREAGAERFTAAFDERLRSFYTDLDFAVVERDGRLWGERDLTA